VSVKSATGRTGSDTTTLRRRSNWSLPSGPLTVSVTLKAPPSV
jgi:hypothetical protein